MPNGRGLLVEIGLVLPLWNLMNGGISLPE